MIKTVSLSEIKSNKTRYLKILIGAIFFVILALFLSQINPAGPDWHNPFRPAALDLLSGKNPYLNSYYYNPPWVLIILAPFALLPERLGSTMISLINLLVFGLFAYRNGAGRIAIAAILLTPLVLLVSYSANIDWMIPLGMMLPPQFGLFFILAKPQIGIGVALYWMWQTWRQGGIRQVIYTFAPVSIAFGLSFLIFGLYPLHASTAIGYGWNYSLWPYGIPLGLILLFGSIHWRKIHLSSAASTLITPYLNYQSYAVSLTVFLPNTLLTVIYCLLHWLAFLIIVK